MRIELKQNVSYIIAYRNVLLQKPIILLFNFICIFMSIVTVIAIAILFFIMDFIPRHREPRVFFLSHSTNWLFITFLMDIFFLTSFSLFLRTHLNSSDFFDEISFSVRFVYELMTIRSRCCLKLTNEINWPSTYIDMKCV